MSFYDIANPTDDPYFHLADVFRSLNRRLEALERKVSSSAWMFGSAPPTAADGTPGDFWLDTSTGYLWGPKINSAWPATPGRALAPGAQWSTYVPAFWQNGTVNATIGYARYMKIGRTVIGSIRAQMTSGGSAGSPVRVSVPVNPADNGPLAVGSGWLYRNMVGNVPFVASIVGFEFWLVPAEVGNGWLGEGTQASGFSVFALGSGDNMYFSFAYESAT